MVSGVIVYFNIACGVIVLYRESMVYSLAAGCFYMACSLNNVDIILDVCEDLL